MTTRISQAFATVKSEQRMAFMPFVTAGDPDMPATLELIREFGRRGVDLIEIGFPYSDPIADGPVIQASYTRALANGLHVADIFAGIGSLKNEKNIPPLVAMVSYAIVFRNGPEQFFQKAKTAGFSGLIIPDLPGDEAAEIAALARANELDLVQLVAPTTPNDRAERILKAASGFVYCISVAGTTGVREALPEELQSQLRELRKKTDLPLAVGFGISRPDQVASLRGIADGVIVGSAVVRHLENVANGDARGASLKSAIEKAGAFAGEMVAAVKAK
ncbi:MAG: tryptophan synthase subunit alpha [Planctomycetaceae bacterium]